MKNNDELPPAVAQLEIICGRFSARLAKILPKELSALAFCGPASFREPEIDNVWHPYMLRRSFLFFLWDQLPKFGRAWAGGLRRFIFGRFGSATLKLRPGAELLGITPGSICVITSEGVETKYCHTDDARQMSWLVMNDAGKEQGGYPISRLRILKTFWVILYAWIKCSFPRFFYDRDWAVATVLTLRWIVGLQWGIQLMLGLKVREVLKAGTFKKIFAVHETHPWSRIVWSESKQQGVGTITIQHASISRSKLWYFPMREELQAGLVMPDEFVVFSQKEQDLLKPFFPTVARFYFGCGPRFSQWQTAKINLSQQKNAQASVLFVSSVPWWDNEVVLLGVKKLLQEAKISRPIIVRLHPLAAMSRSWDHWLKKMSKKRLLSISRGSLVEDLGQSVAVVGMNTTVLEESMAMGLAVIALESNKYLSFATALVKHIPVVEFTWEEIERNIDVVHSQQEKYMQIGRQAMAIDMPVFRINLD